MADVVDVPDIAAVVERAEVVEPVESAGLDEVAEPDLDEIDEAHTEVLPWQPVFDQTDDLKGLLKARGRLLSRAFHGVGADDH